MERMTESERERVRWMGEKLAPSSYGVVLQRLARRSVIKSNYVVNPVFEEEKISIILFFFFFFFFLLHIFSSFYLLFTLLPTRIIIVSVRIIFAYEGASGNDKTTITVYIIIQGWFRICGNKFIQVEVSGHTDTDILSLEYVKYPHRPCTRSCKNLCTSVSNILCMQYNNQRRTPENYCFFFFLIFLLFYTFPNEITGYYL